jgi:3-methylcrotonyl-CoA carboxylase alpha subunit
MLAKLIVRGADRPQALARLRQALAAVEIAGVTTNVAFLSRVAGCRAFVQAQLDTGLIERSRAELFPPAGDAPVEALAAAAFAELAEEEREARRRATGGGDPHSPWDRVDGWRLNEDSHHDFVFLDGEVEHSVRVLFVEGALRLKFRGAEHALAGEPLADGLLRLALDGRSFKARAVQAGADWHVFWNGHSRRLTLKEELPAEAQAHGGSLTAPMPGKVVQVLARTGANVRKGDALIVLEAMKMEHTIAAPADGVVKEIHFAAGEQVLEGAVLISMD